MRYSESASIQEAPPNEFDVKSLVFFSDGSKLAIDYLGRHVAQRGSIAHTAYWKRYRRKARKQIAFVESILARTPSLRDRNGLCCHADCMRLARGDGTHCWMHSGAKSA